MSVEQQLCACGHNLNDHRDHRDPLMATEPCRLCGCRDFEQQLHASEPVDQSSRWFTIGTMEWRVNETGDIEFNGALPQTDLDVDEDGNGFVCAEIVLEWAKALDRRPEHGLQSRGV